MQFRGLCPFKQPVGRDPDDRAPSLSGHACRPAVECRGTRNGPRVIYECFDGNYAATHGPTVGQRQRPTSHGGHFEESFDDSYVFRRAGSLADPCEGGNARRQQNSIQE